jgi:predicted phosphate transport protein (TIGR00153 family)
MRLLPTPRDTRFYDLFTSAAANIVVGVGHLRELLTAPDTERDRIATAMRAAEHVGDDLTHAIIEYLDKSFVTPFDREDIYRLAVRVDDVLDYLEAAVDLTVLYRVAQLPDEVGELVDLLCQAAELTAVTMPRLREVTGLVSYWKDVNQIEDDADRVYRRFLARLFSGEFDTLTVMKLKEIADQLEAAADGFEHLADVLHTMAVKES